MTLHQSVLDDLHPKRANTCERPWANSREKERKEERKKRMNKGRKERASPGHAGKEGPQLAMTGAYGEFSQAAASVWGFSCCYCC